MKLTAYRREGGIGLKRYETEITLSGPFYSYDFWKHVNVLYSCDKINGERQDGKYESESKLKKAKELRCIPSEYHNYTEGEKEEEPVQKT